MRKFFELYWQVVAFAIIAMVFPIVIVVSLCHRGQWTVWGAIQAVCSATIIIFAGVITLLQTFQILFDSTTAQRRLTPLGILAFFLIIASGLIGLVSNIANEYEKKSAEQTSKSAHDKEVADLQKRLSDILLANGINSKNLTDKIESQARTIRDNQAMLAGKATQSQSYEAKITRLQQKNESANLTAQQQRIAEEEKNRAIQAEISATGRHLQALNTTIKGFERVLQPIKDVSISYIVKIPSDDPECQQIIRNFESLPEAKDKNTIIKITSNDKNFPQGQDSVVASLIKSFKINLRFWKNAADAKKWIALSQKDSATMLEQRFVINVSDLVLQTDINPDEIDVEIGYVPASKQLFLYYHGLKPVSPYWFSSSTKIRSVTDMHDATVLAYRRFEQNTATAAGNKRLESLLKRSLIGAMIISVSGSLNIIYPAQMQRLEHRSYDNICIFKFRSFTELEDLKEDERIAFEDASLIIFDQQKNIPPKNQYPPYGYGFLCVDANSFCALRLHR